MKTSGNKPEVLLKRNMLKIMELSRENTIYWTL